MELLYKSKDGQFTVKLNSDDQKDLFEQLSDFQEVFISNNKCICGNENIYFRTRTAEGNKFYEKHCNNCGKSFSYGQNKKGNTLFPKGPWVKWIPNQEDNKIFTEKKG